MNVVFPPKMPPTESQGYGRHKVLAPDWSIVIERPGKKDIIFTFPVGFVTDFFSVPGPFTPVVPRDGKSNIPALIHDGAYATGGFRNLPGDKGLTRYECDQLLLLAMERCGFSFWKRRQIYLAVRLGGWVPWNRLRAEHRCIKTPALD